METSKTETISNEPEWCDPDDVEPISKALKQTDDGAETERNYNVKETQEPINDNSQKDTDPIQKPELMQRSD